MSTRLTWLTYGHITVFPSSTETFSITPWSGLSLYITAVVCCIVYVFWYIPIKHVAIGVYNVLLHTPHRWFQNHTPKAYSQWLPACTQWLPGYLLLFSMVNCIHWVNRYLHAFSGYMYTPSVYLHTLSNLHVLIGYLYASNGLLHGLVVICIY